MLRELARVGAVNDTNIHTNLHFKFINNEEHKKLNSNLKKKYELVYCPLLKTIILLLMIAYQP